MERKKPLRILFILQSDFPPDPRLSREMKVMVGNQYRVHLICNNRKNAKKTERFNGVHIHRIISPFQKLKKINKLLTIPSIFNPLWIFSLIKILNTYKIDVIHVINLPLAPLAIIIGKIFKITIIYDMYENYPEAIRSWRLKGLKAITRHPSIADWLDHFCMEKAHFLIVVVQEAKDRIVEMGIRKDKIFTVENTIDLDVFESMPIDNELVQRYAKTINIVYTGQFSKERGLDTAIEGIDLIKNIRQDIKLILVGSGPNKNELEKKVRDCKLQNYVEMTGWVDYSLFPSYIELANLCIIPQPSNSFIDTTMPNKVYEYMTKNKPVLVADSKPMRRLIKECRCGEVFISNSAEDFTNKFFQILNSPLISYSHGKEWVEKKYNWVLSSRILIELYAKLGRGLG
jgi:glycosyltransferase involved in cell wall biosynthesis